MDPDGLGTISFDSFCKGIASFLLGKYVSITNTLRLSFCVADKVDNDDRVHLDVVDGYHGDNNSFGGSGDEVGVAAWIM